MELLYTAHVPAGDGPHPTVVLLHGYGANAHDLLGLAQILHGGRALVLCPQAPLAFQIGQGMVGFGWFPITLGAPPDRSAIDAAQGLVERFLEGALARYPVDRRKLVLGGFSQGGVLAYRIALNDPTRFAGLMALSSWLPAELAKEIGARPEHAELPTLVMHGSQDPMIPVDRGRSSRDELLRLGVPTVYREHGGGHGLEPESLRDLVGWLEEKVLSPIQLA